MTYYLVVYDRGKGEVLDLEEFEDRADAMKRRVDRELAEYDASNIEIMMLSSRSRATLEKTHSRYFKTSKELAAGVG